MSQNPQEPSQLKTVFGFLPKKPDTETPASASVTSWNKLSKNQKRIRGERQKIHAPEEIAKEFRVSEKGNLFFRIVRPGRSIHRPAGYIRNDGYLVVRLKGQIYLAHRVVWCLIHGRWPKEQIDHINGRKLDNRPENLREITPAENPLNVTKSNTVSGVVGVTWAYKEKNWRASICKNYKTINLGHFENLQDAIACRKEAEKRFGYLQQNVGITRAMKSLTYISSEDIL